MLREEPGAEDLLATARDVLLNELLPALPAEMRYVAQMAATALMIAVPDGAQNRDMRTPRETLLNDLLPQLPPSKVFAARMVANAIAIAERESAQSPAWQSAVLAGMGGDPRAYAATIRAGGFDRGTPGHAHAAALLDELTRARCAVSAPRALAKG